LKSEIWSPNLTGVAISVFAGPFATHYAHQKGLFWNSNQSLIPIFRNLHSESGPVGPRGCEKQADKYH
jgi:hypothetical protein